MADQYDYIGLFVDKEELLDKLEELNIGDRLERIIEFPHVTLAFMPEKVDRSNFGKKVSIVITGYGNDGANEGLKVYFDSQDLKEIMEKGRNPHITVSLGEKAKAVDTEKLSFDKCTSFTIVGTFGGFHEGRVDTVNSMAEDMLSNESKIVMPFCIEGNKKEQVLIPDSDYFERKTIKFKYLSSYVESTFDESSNIVGTFELTEEGCRKAFGVEPGEFIPAIFNIKDSEERVVNVKIREVLLVVFATGIGFLTLSLGYEKDEPLDTILDINSALSYLRFRIQKDDNCIDVKSALRGLISNSCDKITWCPSSKNDKCNIFHRILADEEREDDMINASMLMRGIGKNISDNRSNGDIDLEKYITNMPDRFWAVDSNGVVSFSYGDKGGSFIRNVYQSNVNREYFITYLLALMKRESYLWFSKEAVTKWNDIDEIISVKEKIIRYDIWSSYNMISTESLYQSFYEKLYQQLNLEMLKVDVEEVVEKAENYSTSRRDEKNEEKDRRVNVILFALSLLTVLSTLIDGVAFAERFYVPEGVPINMWDIPHIIVYVIVALIILGALCIAFIVKPGKKKKKKNKQ